MKPSGPAELRRIHLRYPAKCLLCGKSLEKGTDALYQATTKTVRCIECKPGESPSEIATGSAGASAQREYDRRRVARELRVKAQLGNVIGGLALAITGEPQSTRAWRAGSIGEQKLAEALAGIEDLVVLHDRRVPQTKGNIDHIVVAPSGVFVVDTKRYEGVTRIRDRGGLFSRDDRLYVGRRDGSALATNMRWQTSAVMQAIASAGVDLAEVQVTPVLCFVDGEWPLLLPPESYKGVRIEGMRSIKTLVSGSRVLNREQIDRVSRVLATAFPAK